MSSPGFQDSHRRPRRHHESHHQREEHRGAGADRDRAHVRAHQAAHKGHRKNGRDHGQCGEDRGIAHLVDSFHGDVERRPALIRGHAPVAHDIFHHHDRVVHQNANGEDQREQRDPVQRVAIKIKDCERKRQRDRNRDEHDQRFAQTQRDGDQHAHRDHRDQHVPQQFVRFLLGCVAVIARDGHLDVGRDHAAPQRFQTAQDVFADGDGVGPLAFGNGDCYRRIEALGPSEKRTYCDGSSPPSVTSATSRTKIGCVAGDPRYDIAHVVRAV